MTAKIALFLLVLFFLLLAYVDIFSRKLYKKIKDDKSVPTFYRRIKFFKENRHEHAAQKEEIRKILQAYNASVVLILIVFILYLIGNFVK